jgi:hypothetical protein
MARLENHDCRKEETETLVITFASHHSWITFKDGDYIQAESDYKKASEKGKQWRS